jgi:exosome complex component RRP42
VGGHTDVLAAVKCELVDPEGEGKGDKGRVECSVDIWGAGAGAGAGGVPVLSGRAATLDANAELSAALTRHIASSGAVDLSSLCVLKGKHVWAVYVDLIVTQAGGSLLDACVLAAAAALHDTRMPKLHLLQGEGEGDFDIELDDDPATAVPFPAAALPITVTFSRVGAHFVVDPDVAEEACATGRVLVSVNRRGNVCAVQADGSAGIEPATLQAAVQAARDIAPSLFSKVDAAVASSGTAVGDGAVGVAPEGGYLSSLLGDVGTTVIDSRNVVDVKGKGKGKGKARGKGRRAGDEGGDMDAEDDGEDDNGAAGAGAGVRGSGAAMDEDV